MAVQESISLELPDREEYDDYYQLIKKPIAMDMIRDKLDNKKYKSLKELQRDVLLMSYNAMEYNEVGSIVYEDAQEISNIVDNWYKTALETLDSFELAPNTFETKSESINSDSISASSDEKGTSRYKGRSRKNANKIDDDEEAELEEDDVKHDEDGDETEKATKKRGTFKRGAGRRKRGN